jgi:hypothetical protein
MSRPNATSSLPAGPQKRTRGSRYLSYWLPTPISSSSHLRQTNHAGGCRICDMHGDFASDGEWIVACPESGEPHELRIPKHPFSPAQGVTCERAITAHSPTGRR